MYSRMELRSGIPVQVLRDFKALKSSIIHTLQYIEDHMLGYRLWRWTFYCHFWFTLVLFYPPSLEYQKKDMRNVPSPARTMKIVTANMTISAISLPPHTHTHTHSCFRLDCSNTIHNHLCASRILKF